MSNTITSKASPVGHLVLPLFTGEASMMPFDLHTLEGLDGSSTRIVKSMLSNVPHSGGTAYFTLHGKELLAGETLRRGGAHIDGNYDPVDMGFGGGGWKTGEEGRPPGHPIHERQFTTEQGGIVLASNYPACVGWIGAFEGIPQKGGDCTSFDLGQPFVLTPNTVYYGNNHFIHESLPVAHDVHRVFARVTMPEDHIYKG